MSGKATVKFAKEYKQVIEKEQPVVVMFYGTGLMTEKRYQEIFTAMI